MADACSSAGGVAPIVFGRALLARGTAMLGDLRTSISQLEFLADPAAGRLRIAGTGAMEDAHVQPGDQVISRVCA